MVRHSFTWLIYLGILFAAYSCGTSTNQADQPAEEMEQPKSKAYTAAYVCPMHCEGSGSEEPGKCPVCDMAYVQNKDQDGHGHEGHDHNHGDHEGHNH